MRFFAKNLMPIFGADKANLWQILLDFYQIM